MITQSSLSVLKESISAMSAQIRERTDKINGLYERMETVGTAIAGCRKTLEGLALLDAAYGKAKTNDMAAFSEQFGFVAEFCTAKLERWQQYWVDLNNEAALLSSENKAQQFKWEEARAKYNRAVKVQEKKGELI